jgi:hypothetical protein
VALADPRANDPEQTIDGRRTFAQYMAERRTLDGKPVPPYNPSAPWSNPPARSPVNDESSGAYQGALRLAWDWSREQAFGTPTRAAFRRDPNDPRKSVLIGEYMAACDSPWSPVRVRPKTYLHQMDGIFHSDVQCTGWYGGLEIARDPVHQTDSPGAWPTVENWLRVYPNSERDPKMRERRMIVDVMCGIAEGHARTKPTAPLAPYVFNGPEAYEDDMVEYLRRCRALGMKFAIIFMAPADRAAHDYWKRVVERVSA